MTNEASAPPGWYPDPQEVGRQRWWDGTHWGQQAPLAPTANPVASLPADPAVAVTAYPGEPFPGYGYTAPPREDWWRSRPAIAVIIALVLVAGVGSYLAVTRSKHTPSVNTASWIQVADQQVGFTDRLPGQPTDRSLPAMTISNARLTLNLAVIGSADGGTNGAQPRIVIERGEISPALPPDEFAVNLRTAIYSFAGGSGFNLKSQHSSSFQGHQAWTGIYESPQGTTYDSLAFFDSGSELYVISAPAGYYAPIIAGFQPTAAGP